MPETTFAQTVSHDIGPPSKRIRTDQPRLGTDQGYWSPYVNQKLVEAATDLHNRRGNSQTAASPTVPQDIANDALPGSSVQLPVSQEQAQNALPLAKMPPGMHQPAFQVNRPSELIGVSNNFGVDFSQAPHEPLELAKWVTAHLKRLLESKVAPKPSYSPMVVYPMGGDAQPSEPAPEIDPEAEKERLREENRERKKRWRQTNIERNKDNDLRCRVNKIAKAKFGSEDTEEKRAFIEQEFFNRRAKREQKQRNKAKAGNTQRGFSNVSMAHIRYILRTSLKAATIAGTEECGRLLIDVLYAMEGSQSDEAVRNAARLLQQELHKGQIYVQAAVEAMILLARNGDLKKALGLAQQIDDEEQDATSMEGEEGSRPGDLASGQRDMPSYYSPQQSSSYMADTSAQAAQTIGQPQLVTPHHSQFSANPTEQHASTSSNFPAQQTPHHDPESAPDPAAALLMGMAGFKDYSSPYGTAQHPASEEALVSRDETNGIDLNMASTSSKDKGLNESSKANNILQLAMAASMTDDEEDHDVSISDVRSDDAGEDAHSSELSNPTGKGKERESTKRGKSSRVSKSKEKYPPGHWKSLSKAELGRKIAYYGYPPPPSGRVGQPWPESNSRETN